MMGEARVPNAAAARVGRSDDAATLAAEQVAIVGAVYRRFAQSAAESFATIARAPSQFSVTAVATLNHRDLRARWAAPAALASVALDPLPGAMLWAVDRPLAFLLIDRLLGGHGAPVVPARGLSEIEGMVLQRGLAALLPDLQRAWAPVCAVVPRLEYLERHADTTDLLAEDAGLLCATFAVAAGGQEGQLHLAAAEASLAAIGHRLQAREYPPRRAERAARAHAMLTVDLGGRGLHPGGGPVLDEGTVIGIGRFTGEPVAIEIDSRPVARGQVVALDDSYAIRVTEILGSGRAMG